MNCGIAHVEPYRMVEAKIVEDQIQFASEADFKEAVTNGFFRVKAPEGVDLKVGREFARTFSSNSSYTDVGKLNVAEGYLTSEENQTVRFTLEKNNWVKYYPEEIQKLGSQLNRIGMMALRCCFEKIKIPKTEWNKASSGSISNNGSHFLLFNCYDPKNASGKKAGVVPHKDWSYVTVLDAIQPGLQAMIDGKFRPLILEDGYLTINFGRPLELLTQKTEYPVKASLHMVVPQTEEMRTSTVLFVDPNLKGYVWEYKKEGGLHSSQTTKDFFEKCSQEIYGEKQ